MRALSSFGIGIVLAALIARPKAVDPNELLHPPADSWLTFHGGYSGQRHTNLS